MCGPDLWKMKLYRRYFCYGSLVTSVLWIIFIYYFLLNFKEKPADWMPQNLLGDPADKRPARLKPRFDLVRRPEAARGDERKKEEDLSELALIHGPEDQALREEGYRLYAFNVLISDRLSLHRNIPDVRHHLCQTQTYPQNLPSASVVICFYNEAWSALLRTVHSVIDRSPTHLLHEIILVDDSSDLPHLGSQLESYLAEHLPQTKLVRTQRREGLIRARMLGAENARGDVLVFLDSHCEVNTLWLEPLLAHIHSNISNVAIPIIDIINQDTFFYESSPLVRGGFNWGLFYRWDQIPDSLLVKEEDYVRPIKTPTMAGGLFAMSRKYFNDLGQYDPGMDIWGGENLELSFRVWQCGGRLDIIPCSRVGHIFRKRRPYGSPVGEDTITHNSLRVAHVWMDEYIKYYLQVRKSADSVKYGDISERVALRQRLQCRPFSWYLSNVYPEQTLPSDKEGGGVVPRGHDFRKNHKKSIFIRRGHLKHVSSTHCVVAVETVFTKHSLLHLKPCDPHDKNEVWHETEEGALQLAGVLCLDWEEARPQEGKAYPKLSKCHFGGGSQGWMWVGKDKKVLMNPASGRCLSVTDAETPSLRFLTLTFCDKTDPNQQFILRDFKS